MANEWTYAALASWETTARAADRPLLGAQSIPNPPDVSRWSEVGQIGSTDRTLAANPANRINDGFVNFITKHDTTTDDVWYLVFDFGVGGIEFDFYASIGDNLGTIALDAETLELDNGGVAYPTAPSSPDGTFANVVSIPLVATPSDDTRRMVLDLDHTGAGATYRYTGVRYARLKFDKTGTNITPEITEAILGRSCQLKNEPVSPFDPTSLHGDSNAARSGSAITHRIIHHEGRYDLSASILSADANEIAAIIAWHKASAGSFVWIYKPNSAPDEWHFMTRELDLDFPSTSDGWKTRVATIEGSEQGPERLFLSQE